MSSSKARVLVLATGPLSAPALPNLPGLDRFAGATMHSGYNADVQKRLHGTV